MSSRGVLIRIIALLQRKTLIETKNRTLKCLKWHYLTVRSMNQRKTIVNSWVCCLENNQLVITSGFPTVNFRK